MTNHLKVPLNIFFPFYLCCLGLLFSLAGCEKKPEHQPSQPIQTQSQEPTPITDTIRKAWNHYHIHGVHTIAQAVECLVELKQQIVAFIKEPNQEHLDQSRQKLAECQQLYIVTDIFIAAHPSAQQEIATLRQRINAPLEMPGFIDSVSQYPFSGIVNDTSLELNKEELIQQHGLTDVSDVSLGFAVIGFLLWGEHQYQKNISPRSPDDFAVVKAWQAKDRELGLTELDIKEHPQNRRRRYLELAVLILQEDMNTLASTWNKHTLPPLNMTVANKLKKQIQHQLINTLSDNSNPTLLAEVVVPLFVAPATAAPEAQVTLTHWFEFNNQQALDTLSNNEIPVAQKLTALHSLIDSLIAP